MATDLYWKSEAAFATDVHTADEVRLREIHSWTVAGERRASSNGRHSSPKARRGWKARRESVEAEMAKRGLEL